jgi:2-amino-4-hydroxy-6-hydroxymethyldihydropteridine diphosphokinase
LNVSKRITEHNVCLLLGSNIRPEYYFPLAIQRLKRFVNILDISDPWESDPIGSIGPRFINAALLVCAHLSLHQMKYRVLRKIEATLGRERKLDKFAPRTMDIDIITYDNNVIDENLWQYPYVAIPCSQLIPEFTNPNTCESLVLVAKRLLAGSHIESRPDFLQYLHLPDLTQNR